MSAISWINKQHRLSGDEIASITKAIQEAGSVQFCDYQKPENFKCQWSDTEIAKVYQQGTVAYNGLDWLSTVYNYGALLNEGVNWIPFVRARNALAECHTPIKEAKIASILEIVSDVYLDCPGESALYLVMALLKAKDKLFHQALQWLHFSSITHGCPIPIHQYVCDGIEFRMKCFRADIDLVLPHLLKPCRLSELKNDEFNINFERLEPILEQIREDASYLEQVWDDDEFVALIDLARSKYDEKKWYLHLDEDVSPQESHIASIDESEAHFMSEVLIRKIIESPEAPEIDNWLLEATAWCMARDVRFVSSVSYSGSIAHASARRGLVPLIHLLIDYGVDFEEVNDENQSAFDLMPATQKSYTQ